MNNYMHTTEPGTSRRRAKSITINYPAQPLVMPARDSVEAQNLPVPSVIFVMEDRVIMADGSEMFIPAGNLVVNIDNDTLTKQYPHVNMESGTIDNDKKRYGGQIMHLIVNAFEDVFVTEGMARDDAANQAATE